MHSRRPRPPAKVASRSPQPALTTPRWLAICAALSTGAYLVGERAHVVTPQEHRAGAVAPRVCLPSSAAECEAPEEPVEEVAGEEFTDDGAGGDEHEPGGVYTFGSTGEEEEVPEWLRKLVDEVVIDEEEEIVGYASAGPASVRNATTGTPWLLPVAFSGSGAASSPAAASASGLAGEAGAAGMAGLPYGAAGAVATRVVALSSPLFPSRNLVPSAPAPAGREHKSVDVDLYVKLCETTVASDKNSGAAIDNDGVTVVPEASAGAIGDPPPIVVSDGTPAPPPPRREADAPEELAALAEAAGLPVGSDPQAVCNALASASRTLATASPTLAAAPTVDGAPDITHRVSTP